jgi:hypothetical protein
MLPPDLSNLSEMNSASVGTLLFSCSERIVNWASAVDTGNDIDRLLEALS